MTLFASRPPARRFVLESTAAESPIDGYCLLEKLLAIHTLNSGKGFLVCLKLDEAVTLPECEVVQWFMSML